jgi:ElaB/YqjD/DUF883 family membrane-anchored ribosome-binding protein
MTRSTQELRLESERSRAELAVTVEKLRERVADTAEEIRDRVSPAHIKSEISDAMHSKMENWVHGLQRQARENPIQAVAVGTTIAVPLLRMARAVPLPLLMIGAGLALTSKTVRERAVEATGPALEKAGAVLDEAVERAQDFGIGLQHRVSSVQSQAADVQDRAVDFGDDLAESLRSRATNAVHSVSDRMRSSGEAVANVAAAAPAEARRFVADNATLIGGVGLAIGAIIGAAFPATKVEAKVAGRASDNLKRAASDAAQSGFETARDSTLSALDTAASKIAEADLGGAATRMTQKMTDTLGQAADDVERAALGTSRNPDI